MSNAQNRGRIISRAALTRMWADPGLSRAQIGQMLGISASAVGHRAKAFGLPPRVGGEKPHYDLDCDLFGRMWEANVRPDEMGRHFGVRTHAILWNARRRGLSRICNRHNSIGLAEYAEIELGHQMAVSAAADRAAHAERERVIRESLREGAT